MRDAPAQLSHNRPNQRPKAHHVYTHMVGRQGRLGAKMVHYRRNRPAVWVAGGSLVNYLFL